MWQLDRELAQQVQPENASFSPTGEHNQDSMVPNYAGIPRDCCPERSRLLRIIVPQFFQGSEEMRKLAIAIAVGAAALLGGTAANADNSAKTEGATVGTSQATDFSAHRRHRHYGHRHHRHYGHRHHRHHRSYGYYAPRRSYYAPQAYYAQPYYGGGYGYGGPSISLGFGGIGLGFGGHRHHGW